MPIQAVPDSVAAVYPSQLPADWAAAFKGRPVAHHKVYDQKFAIGRLAHNGTSFPKLGINADDLQKFSGAIAAWKTQAGLSESQGERILKYANCASSSCHSGTRRGWIGPSLPMVVTTFVESGIMPPNNPLSSAERRELISILRAIYSAKLTNFLTQPLRDGMHAR